MRAACLRDCHEALWRRQGFPRARHIIVTQRGFGSVFLRPLRWGWSLIHGWCLVCGGRGSCYARIGVCVSRGDLRPQQSPVSGGLMVTGRGQAGAPRVSSAGWLGEGCVLGSGPCSLCPLTPCLHVPSHHSLFESGPRQGSSTGDQRPGGRSGVWAPRSWWVGGVGWNPLEPVRTQGPGGRG